MTILELREKRNTAWNAAKAFLDSHRTEKGTLTAEDDATYSRMEQEIADLGKEIARLERQEALDAELNKPVNKPLISKPVTATEKPAKTGRASDEYKNGMLQALRTNFRQVSNILQEGVDADGGYLVPEEYDSRLIDVLTEENIMRSLGHTINKILRNEKYIGDALLQKTYTTDFLNKTRVKNNDLVPQYYVEGNHEAIIPKDTYLQVQEELVRRRVVKTSANGKKRSYSCNHCFSQIVICGECSEMFRRLHWNNRGVKSIVWRCISRLESTGLECHARTINELVLQDAVVKAINQMLGDKSSYQAQLQLNIASVIRASQATSVENIDEKLMALQQELIQKAQSKEAYDEIPDEIFRLRELRQQTTVDTAARDEQIKRINDLQDLSHSRLPTSPNLTNRWCDAGSNRSPSGMTASPSN